VGAGKLSWCGKSSAAAEKSKAGTENFSKWAGKSSVEAGNAQCERKSYQGDGGIAEWCYVQTPHAGMG